MPQFTPAPRDGVLRSVRENTSTLNARKAVGGGIVVEVATDPVQTEMYGDLTRSYGWVVDEERYMDGRSVLRLEPITEVDR